MANGKDLRVEQKIITEAWLGMLLSLIDHFEGFLIHLITSPGFRGDRDKLRAILRNIKAAGASISTGPKEVEGSDNGN
jgi:hypothetical protein